MKSAARWLAGIVSVAILLLGVRAFLDPVAASAGFGLPMQTDAETTFVRVYGARNALFGAVGLGFVALGMVRSRVGTARIASCHERIRAVIVWDCLGRHSRT